MTVLVFFPDMIENKMFQNIFLRSFVEFIFIMSSSCAIFLYNSTKHSSCNFFAQEKTIILKKTDVLHLNASDTNHAEPLFKVSVS